MTMFDKSMRCVSAPPTSSAYFSTMLKPGVVFRVPAIFPCHFCARATSMAACRAVAHEQRAGPARELGDRRLRRRLLLRDVVALR